MQQLKAVIVDDVRLIRAELKTMLLEYPQIQVVGEAATADDAVQLISNLKPDVIFLDIRLPDYSGFELMDRICVDIKVIFISSFDKYTKEAAKYNVIAFLVKPINKEKLSLAVSKLRSTQSK